MESEYQKGQKTHNSLEVGPFSLDLWGNDWIGFLSFFFNLMVE